MSEDPVIIDDPLHAAARRRPEAPAVVTPGGVLSYSALDRLVAATAQRLQDLGLHGPACRIGLVLPNGRPALVLLLAAMRAGSVACVLSTRVPPRGVEALLRQVGAKVLITDRSDLAGSIDVHLPASVVAEAADLGAPVADVPRPAAGQPATIVFTSGSTGDPKAVLHSLGNHYFSALGSNENLALGTGGRWLLALPLYHVGGLGIVFRCLLAGAALVVPEADLPIPEAVARYGVTHVSLVATQLWRLLREPADPEGLEAILLGGSALPASLLHEAHARKWPVYTSYGLTEMASQVTTTPPGASLEQWGTSGRLLPYRNLRIAGDGEILVRGATLFPGYVEGAHLRRPLDAEGWFHTGDLGTLDADGFLHVRGRKDHRFISGGENIQPEEIERALCSLDGVAQAVVVPVADEEFGHRPVAFVQRTGGGPSHAALAARLEEVLPRFKIPTAFYDWPGEAPKTGMKVDRAFFEKRAAAMRAQKP